MKRGKPDGRVFVRELVVPARTEGDGTITLAAPMVGLVPPTHESTFTSGSAGNTVDITMLGEPFTVAYDLYVQFVVDQCDAAGIDGGTCRVVLSAFDMTTTSPIQVGDYVAIDGTLDLNARVAATASFGACRHGQCKGTFEMSNRNGNPIGINLFWTQRNTQTSSIDEGAIHLGNGVGALGGVEALTGELTLDTSGSTGTLRLVGGGADALGGDFATADFDLLGSVAPLTVLASPSTVQTMPCASTPSRSCSKCSAPSREASSLARRVSASRQSAVCERSRSWLG
jgi:hypothetical protein